MQLLNEPLKVEEQTVWVGASIGVAVFPDDASNMEELCIAADLRMYHDKNHSKGLKRSATERGSPEFDDRAISGGFRTIPD